MPQANGLLVNIGTLNDRSWQLYKDALDIAEKHDIPTVLDPVAAGAGKFRQQVALDLIEHHRMSLLRGNAGEIAALIGERVASKGLILHKLMTLENLLCEPIRFCNSLSLLLEKRTPLLLMRKFYYYTMVVHLCH